jgi:glycosyltransferase involved in cell wall biosynthesis
MLPKISIITPSYNQGKYIERTIKSVLNQNYPNLEYIVMDGGSTDNTISILKKYSHKIIWQSKKDDGQGGAINQGFKKATGEILSYLNSDDTLEPGALEIVAQKYLDNPQLGWFVGKCRIINEKDMEIRKFITVYKNYWLSHYHRYGLLVLNFISQPAVFITNAVYKKTGEFNPKEYFEIDYDYWLRLSKKYSPIIIDYYLANFRAHKASRTSSDTLHFWQEIRTARKYTNNPFLIGLHLINYISILLGYLTLFKIK